MIVNLGYASLCSFWPYLVEGEVGAGVGAVSANPSCFIRHQLLDLGFVQQLSLSEFLGWFSVADCPKVEDL